MLDIGHKGTLYRNGKTIRALVCRVRGGNRVDLTSNGIPPDQLQMVPIGAGEGCFLPDAYEVAPTVGPEDPTPVQLIARPEKAPVWPWVSALAMAAASLGWHIVNLLGGP